MVHQKLPVGFLKRRLTASGNTTANNIGDGEVTIFKNSIQDHLTSGPVDTLARATHPGMAHFAGTGPALKTCRECIFWNHRLYDYRAKNGKWRGLILPADCNKYRQMTQRAGEKIPDYAAACKYFEENPTIPARYAK